MDPHAVLAANRADEPSRVAKAGHDGRDGKCGEQEGDPAARAGAGLIGGEDPVRPSYLIWTTIHSITSIEPTHALRSPLPRWFIDSPEAGEQALIDGVRAALAGLG